jgi:hypothetical protein
VTIFRPGAVAAVVILTVFAHGLQAGDLGLYWDDAEQLMQGLQGVDYRVLDFIVSDTAHSLPSERPLAYLAFVLTRAAFAFSVGAVHWTLVAWLALDAALLGSLARTIVDDDWFVFAVGTTFVLYPLAFVQTIWPATIHYHLAWFFASAAMLAAGKSGSVDPRRARWWLACGALAYASSLLTQEAVGFIPLAFVGLHALSGRRAVRAAITLGGVFALFAVWRTLLLPLYGDQFYSPSMPFLHPGVVISKALRNATAAALFPWRQRRRSTGSRGSAPVTHRSEGNGFNRDHQDRAECQVGSRHFRPGHPALRYMIQPRNRGRRALAIFKALPIQRREMTAASREER